jgi:hypothetical protein
MDAEGHIPKSAKENHKDTKDTKVHEGRAQRAGSSLEPNLGAWLRAERAFVSFVSLW